MITLLCYPTPLTGSTQIFDPEFAQQALDATKAHGLRVNFDRRAPLRPKDVPGEKILPIIDLDDYDIWADRRRITQFACDILEQCGDRLVGIEVGNEPYTMHRMPAGRYHAIAMDIWLELNHRAKIILAGDVGRPDGYFAKDWLEWGRVALFGKFGHAIAIHPYYSKFISPASRAIDWARWQYYTGMRELWVTEVGYDAGVPNRGRLLKADLEWFEKVEVPVVCVYATGGGFGVLGERSRELTEVGQVVRNWQEQRT